MLVLYLLYYLIAASSSLRSYPETAYRRIHPEAGLTEHRLLHYLLRNYDTDARGVASNSTVRVEIQLLLLRIQGLVSVEL